MSAWTVFQPATCVLRLYEGDDCTKPVGQCSKSLVTAVSYGASCSLVAFIHILWPTFGSDMGQKFCMYRRGVRLVCVWWVGAGCWCLEGSIPTWLSKALWHPNFLYCASALPATVFVPLQHCMGWLWLCWRVECCFNHCRRRQSLTCLAAGVGVFKFQSHYSMVALGG